MASRIAFRVTAKERAEIEERARSADLSVSDYARDCVNWGRWGYRDLPAPRKERQEIDRQAISALNRVGNNLWQITRRLNYGGSVPNDLVEAIDEVRAAVAKLSEDV